MNEGELPTTASPSMLLGMKSTQAAGAAPEPPAVAEVLGQSARLLRGKHTAELVAYAATSAGLNWGSGRISDLEAGRVSPTLPTLFALCQAFGALLDRPIGLADLFAGDGQVRLTGTALTVELAELRAALSGQPVDAGPAVFIASMDLAGAVASGEQFTAAGVKTPDVIAARVQNHPARKLGRVARELKASADGDN
jgi:transcriptional regulator with XRE-family HTH domain